MTVTRIEQKIVACSDLFRIDGTDITVSVVDFSDPIVMIESRSLTAEGGWGFEGDVAREWIAPLRQHQGGVIALSSSGYGAHVELDLTADVARDLADALDQALAQVPVYPDWLEMDRLMDDAEGDVPHVVRGLDLTITADPHTRELTLTDQDGTALTLAESEAVGMYQQLVAAEDTPAQALGVLIPGGWVLSGATGSGKSHFINQLRFMLAQLDSLDAPGAQQI
ncbi:hypothetical protein [Tsukamurella pseudospumae]|uniref:Uncharacterized protein n=1 Tax=Tsukamurella pseudospumae TaxID=239498 RepID=A0A138AWA1_9ACTN|nr:hypothetical protein [Tsukamurella pseudospumae]KXP14710.1 hypothetical protein AXK60_02135 [Tsukamurella pseudospumae]